MRKIVVKDAVHKVISHKKDYGKKVPGASLSARNEPTIRMTTDLCNRLDKYEQISLDSIFKAFLSDSLSFITNEKTEPKLSTVDDGFIKPIVRAIIKAKNDTKSNIDLSETIIIQPKKGKCETITLSEFLERFNT